MILISYEMRWFCRPVIYVNDPAAAPCAEWISFFQPIFVHHKKCLSPEKDDMNIKVQTHCLIHEISDC